ncbi:hypothetical protein MVEN_01312900 [Mycena venus]|uniref:Uncharacterized protein n=1 Tax=Mycena venus TaxID=2733690 RepID=A0A8H6XYU6_9AGAR|nr:hypothetical protein MVEN_01312900 [Mycena venus]
MDQFTCPYCDAAQSMMQGLHSHRAKSIVSNGLESDIEIPMNAEQAGNGLLSDISKDENNQDLHADPHNDNTPPGSPSPAPDPALNAGKRRRATVEEVEDEKDEQYVEDFPKDTNTGEWRECCKTYFQKLRDEQKDAGNAPWYPFKTEDEWELAKWLMTLGLSQKKTD